MSCSEHIVGLLPDYHLGQLSPEEEAEVRRHLREHPECREELEDVARVLDLMPLAAGSATPRPELKEMTLSRALGTNEAGGPRAGEPRPRQSRIRGAIWPLVAALTLGIAVISLVLVGTAYLDLRQDNENLWAEVQELQKGPPPDESLVVAAVGSTSLAPEARGTAVLDPRSGDLALDVYNLPQPAEERSYRVWLIDREGQPASLGVMELDDRGDGRMTGDPERSLDSYAAVEITSEPSDASGKTGPVYLQARL